MDGILGKKLGMTQIYGEDGSAIPVTVIQVGPCLVVQRKTRGRDGYEAVQLGLVEETVPRKVTQPMRGHFERAGVPPLRRLVEFPVGDDEALKPGDSIGVDIFAADERVDVTATSKGKGFQGVIKRHGFGGGRATHGSMFHRAPGSIGQASAPSRVFPGLSAAGRMGSEQVTTKNLRVVRIDEERSLMFVKGAVPGPRNGYVAIRRAQSAGGRS